MIIEKEQAVKNLILQDDSILAEIEKVKSADDFLSIFHNRGLDLTIEEAEDLLEKQLSEGNGELSEEMLSDVAGGMTGKQAFFIGTRVGIAARMVYDGCKYGNPYKNYNMGNLITGKFW